MGQEFKPSRKVYIKEKISPIALQKDPLNFGYVIVQACSDIKKSVEQCSFTPGNFLIVIADNQYKFSPFVKELLVFLANNLNKYYLYLVMMFFIITVLIGLFTQHFIKKDITGPIIKLKKSLKLD